LESSKFEVRNIYNKELAIGNENKSRGLNNLESYKVFRAKCNSDLQQFMSKNNYDYKGYTFGTLKMGHYKFMTDLSKGVSFDEAIKKLPVNIRESYKEHLIELGRNRQKV